MSNEYNVCKKMIEFYNKTPNINSFTSWGERMEKDFSLLINLLITKDIEPLINLMKNFKADNSLSFEYINVRENKIYFLLEKAINKTNINEKHKFGCINKIGNPKGVLINDKVLTESSIRHYTDSNEICSLVAENSTVCEIGGGHGGLASQLLFNKKLKYIDCDLPSSLIIIFYFLSMSFNDKKILWVTSEDEIIENDYDIILIPNYFKNIIPKIKIDLFFNSYSFSEMNINELKCYKDIIENSQAEFFLHENCITDTNPLLIPCNFTFNNMIKINEYDTLDNDNNKTCKRFLYKRIKEFK
jgi:putative sugar O-methyltransferase